MVCVWGVCVCGCECVCVCICVCLCVCMCVCLCLCLCVCVCRNMNACVGRMLLQVLVALARWCMQRPGAGGEKTIADSTL